MPAAIAAGIFVFASRPGGQPLSLLHQNPPFLLRTQNRNPKSRGDEEDAACAYVVAARFAAIA
jgi:hypothetical protein